MQFLIVSFVYVSSLSYMWLRGLIFIIGVASSSFFLTGREESTLSYRVFEDTGVLNNAKKTALVMHGILGASIDTVGL